MPSANTQSKRAATEVSVLDFHEGAVAEELREALARSDAGSGKRSN